MKRIEYKYGDLISGIKYVAELDSKRNPNGEIRRYAVFECPLCSNHFTQRIRDIVSGKTVTCGCKKRLGNVKHGLRYTKYYKEWQNIKNRCFNPNVKQFKDYGGRNITMYEKWINDFMSFYNYIISLHGHESIGCHKDQLTIDRINNNGNYEPENLKFSTKKEQSNNRRKAAA